MTRARILADYVSSGDELALKAPLASPAFTGSPSITLGLDATGDVYYRAAGGALTRLATGADGTVLTSTGAAAVPAFEAIPAGGITMIDQWYLDTSFTANAVPIDSNITRKGSPAYANPALLGSAMTEASGVFTFPSTGMYQIGMFMKFSLNFSQRYFETRLDTTDDNGSGWDTVEYTNTYMHHNSSWGTSNSYTNASIIYLFDVVNESTHKCRFAVTMDTTGGTVFGGAQNGTGSRFIFIRLGDT